MEKKKLLEQLSKSFRTKEELLADGIFLKVKGDPSSARFFELYDRSIVYYAVRNLLNLDVRKKGALEKNSVRL